jgi:DNA-binding MarR family transcriptional regulator
MAVDKSAVSSVTSKSADLPLDQGRLLALVGYNCRRAYIPILSLFLQRLEEYKLRPVDYSVLVLLESNGDVTQKRLSKAINVSPPNLAVLLDKLEQRKLIMRTPNPNDKRSQTLHLTDAGRDLVGRAEKMVSRVERDATSMLTDSERSTLIGLLQQLFMQSRADSPRPRKRPTRAVQ